MVCPGQLVGREYLVKIKKVLYFGVYFTQRISLLLCKYAQEQ